PGSPNEDLAWTLALDQFQMGEAHVQLASIAKRSVEARREDWRQALGFFQKSMPGISAATSGGFRDIALSTLQEARREVEQCERELAR
ncbi:MAG TPA: hypothetical protein VKT81_09495, partial [Bryobacteraceae bacterium]|nr:hypothetical protein [Bryobacteraceae bacterium]